MTNFELIELGRDRIDAPWTYSARGKRSTASKPLPEAIECIPTKVDPISQVKMEFCEKNSILYCMLFLGDFEGDSGVRYGVGKVVYCTLELD